MQTNQNKKARRSPGGVRGLPLAAIVIAAILLAMLLISCAGGGNAPEPAENVIKNPVQIHYITPGGETTGDPVEAGTELTLPEAEQIDGYRFTGWKDVNGNTVGSTLTVDRDLWLAAEYAVALNTREHIPYLTADDMGFFRPCGIITRGEAAEVLYTLMEVKLTNVAGFTDMEPGTDTYTAAAALKQLGIAEGSRFHPEDPLTQGDLLRWLSKLYPRLRGEVSFQNLTAESLDYSLYANAALHGWIDSGAEVRIDPDADLTRGDFACIMNRVLGRSAANAGDSAMTGTLPDVPFSSPYYADLAEACVAHSYRTTDGVEVWSSSETPARWDTGFLMLDGGLYYVGGDGVVLAGCEYNGFTFDENGRYTSGDAELDATVRGIIAEVMPTDVERTEQLRALYKYITRNYSYQKGTMYKQGETLPAEELAKAFFATGRGNCYGFACAFYELARATGWEAGVYSGKITGSPHGWVEITMDGHVYVCDTEMQWAYNKKGDYRSFFMMDETAARTWYYVK